MRKECHESKRYYMGAALYRLRIYKGDLGNGAYIQVFYYTDGTKPTLYLREKF
jgi:hypothetical protein